jgi:hypothetical protein
VIIGAQKAGTTALKLALKAHPDVDAPRGECPFFEDPYYDSDDLGPLEALFAGSTASVRVIKRPDYLAHPECAERIHRHLLDVSLVAVLRHPVERAVSAYFHFVARGMLPLRGLDNGMRRLLQGDERPAAQDVLNYGYYHRQLTAYTNVFPRERLHVIRYEELRFSFGAALHDVQVFLGLDPERMGSLPPLSANESMYALPRLSVHRLRTRIRSDRDTARGHTHPRTAMRAPARWASAALHGVDRRALARLDSSKPILAPDLRAELLERYRDDTDQLEVWLGVDLSDWKR